MSFGYRNSSIRAHTEPHILVHLNEDIYVVLGIAGTSVSDIGYMYYLSRIFLSGNSNERQYCLLTFVYAEDIHLVYRYRKDSRISVSYRYDKVL